MIFHEFSFEKIRKRSLFQVALVNAAALFVGNYPYCGAVQSSPLGLELSEAQSHAWTCRGLLWTLFGAQRIVPISY